jgi:hypothetical protein
MDWVRKNWIVLVCGLVAMAGVGVGVWSRLGFSQLQTEANSIAGIVAQLQGMESGAANEATIAEARNYYAKTNKGTIDERDKALASNKRTPLRDDVFPTEKAPDSGYRFRDAYRAAMQKLPEMIKGGKAPNATVVEFIVNRMEDKLRKEVNLTGAGGDLHVPKPPPVPTWVAPTPVPRASPGGPAFGSDHSGGFEEDLSRNRGGFEEDSSRRGGFEQDTSRLRGPAMGAFSPTYQQPGVQPAQPQAAIPTPEQLRPAAKQAAVYQAARAIWTYVNDDSFEMHPLGSPGSFARPLPEDLWARQAPGDAAHQRLPDPGGDRCDRPDIEHVRAPARRRRVQRVFQYRPLRQPEHRFHQPHAHQRLRCGPVRAQPGGRRPRPAEGARRAVQPELLHADSGAVPLCRRDGGEGRGVPLWNGADTERGHRL